MSENRKPYGRRWPPAHLHLVANSPPVAEQWIYTVGQLPDPGTACLVSLDDGDEGLVTVGAWEFNPPRWHIYEKELAHLPVYAWQPMPAPAIIMVSQP